MVSSAHTARHVPGGLSEFRLLWRPWLLTSAFTLCSARSFGKRIVVRISAGVCQRGLSQHWTRPHHGSPPRLNIRQEGDCPSAPPDPPVKEGARQGSSRLLCTCVSLGSAR